MNTLFRNFFFATGLVLLVALHSLNPAEAQFGDLVRLVQSQSAQQLVAVLTVFLVALDFLFHRKGGASVVDVMPLKLSSAGADGSATSKPV